MVGLLLWKEERGERRERAVQVREQSILHLRFRCGVVLRTARTPEAVLRRRVTAALKRLRKQGVDRLVLPGEFPFVDLLEKLELQTVSTVSLRQALAADWVRWLLAERDTASARVAVSADRLTGEVVRTVTEVALRHRYVLLDLPYGGEEVCRQLRREYGVSLLLAPTKEQLAEASGLILFDEQAALTEQKDAVLPLYDEGVPLPPLSLAPAIEEKLPAGADRVQMVAALYQAGVLRAGQITFAHK
jgi:hypothetical protein